MAAVTCGPPGILMEPDTIIIFIISYLFTVMYVVGNRRRSYHDRFRNVLWNRNDLQSLKVTENFTVQQTTSCIYIMRPRCSFYPKLLTFVMMFLVCSSLMVLPCHGTPRVVFGDGQTYLNFCIFVFFTLIVYAYVQLYFK